MEETTNQEQEVQEAPQAEATQEENLNMPILEEMAKSGILFGRKRAVTHPKMRQFIFSTRNGFEIIDLQKTLSQIDKAAEFLSQAASTGLPILYVGIRPEIQDIIKEAASAFRFPYVVQRWPGGALTNFDTINQRIGYYTSLKEDKAAGKHEKYTKKEQVSLEKKIERLDRLFSGLEAMDKLPAALVVVGAKAHRTAIREAKIKNIPVVVIANTDTNPDGIDYLIPANDTSRAGVKFILDKLAAAVEEGKSRLQKAPAKNSENKKPAPQGK